MESWPSQIDRLKRTTCCCAFKKKWPYSSSPQTVRMRQKPTFQRVCAEWSVKEEHTAQTPHLSIKLIWHQHAGLYENKCQLSRQGQFNLSSHRDDQH